MEYTKNQATTGVCQYLITGYYNTKMENHTMKQEKNEVLLTIKDLTKLGAELTEIMQQIDMVNIAIQGLEFTERKDDLTFQWIARQFFNTNYTLNENISKKLDEIACHLLNADNEKELKVLKND